MTKKISLLLVALLVILSLASCAQNKPEPTATPEPTQAASVEPTDEQPTETEWEPATFSIWTWPGSIESWGAKDLNDVLAFQEFEKRTNTKIEWIMQSDSATFDLIMASGDIPDAVYYAWSPVRQGQYAADGLIIDIMPYIQSSAPNLLGLIESDPMVKKQLVRDDGSVYLVPWITADLSLLAGEGFAIRQDWLDKFNLSVPKNPEELYEALKTFREQDANGNEEKDELVTGYPSQFNKSAFAFGTTDGFHIGEDGKTAVYGPMTENYREWLRWMNKLYSENLIDPDYFSWDYDIYMKKNMENRVALYVDNPGVLNTIVKDGSANGLDIKWTPMKYMEYKGKSVNFSNAYKRYVQPYGLAVSKDCEDPARLLKWMDYFFTEEGNLLMNWGVEGVSYEVVNGEKKFLDVVMNDPELVPSTALSKYASPTFMGIQDPKASDALADEFTLACRQAWSDTDISGAWEPFAAFTPEENAINSQYSTDLGTIKDSWRDSFIVGEKDIEEDWDDYLKELEAYHVQDLIQINQAALDRYLAKK